MTDRPLGNMERLREQVATRVQATSLRSVARQVGMSPTGLEKFLAGGTPYTRSRQKLQDWAERETGRPSNDLTLEGVEIAIGALVRDIPAEHRVDAIARLVRTLRAVYQAQGARPPEWLDQLAATWLDEEPAAGWPHPDDNGDEDPDGFDADDA